MTSPPRHASPEQLDRMLRVVPGFAWPALTVLGLLLVAGFAWSVLSSAAATVPARGVLLSPGGVTDVVAPAAGRLRQVLVRPGERIRAGQPVAELEQPEMDADLARLRTEQVKLEEQEERVRGFLAAESESRARLAEGREGRLRTRAAALRTLETTASEMLATQQDLFGRGLTSRDRMLASRRQVEEAASQRSEAESALMQITADTEVARVRGERELLDLAMRLSANARDLAWAEQERARRGSVLSPADGVVAEQVLNAGETAAVSAPILRMLPGEEGDGLVGLLYIPPSAGRRVRPGMAAQVMPTAVRVERHGFIEGEVLEVAPIAATREGMLRSLKNSTLVDQILRDGAPMQVIVRLVPDGASATGFHWSAGRGPDMVMGPGTMVEARVVTERVPLISLVLPQAEYLLSRIGL